MNWRLLLGAALISLSLGSIHAFSVLQLSFEERYGSGRADVSLAYSTAIFLLSAGVLVAPWLIWRLGLALSAILVVTTTTIGLIVVAVFASPSGLLLGFGCLFGFGNGLGYSLFLSAAGQATKTAKTLPIGIVSAAYALGAVLAAQALARGLGVFSIESLLFLWAGSLAALAGSGTYLILKYLTPDRRVTTSIARAPFRLVGRFWAIYLCGAIGALMVAGHAANLVGAGLTSAGEIGPSLFAVSNITGCLLASVLSRKCGAIQSIAVTACVLAVAYGAIIPFDAGFLRLLVIGIAGFGYGLLLTLIPAELVARLGPDAGARAFSKVFTAWGVAGLVGPWFAGWVFDETGGYDLAFALAACLGLLCAALALSNRKQFTVSRD